MKSCSSHKWKGVQVVKSKTIRHGKGSVGKVAAGSVTTAAEVAPIDLGRLYAALLAERAMLLRSSLLLSPKVREQIAFDLDALGKIAELHPEYFRDVPQR